MTEVLKVLGQVSPSAATLTTLYTVPAATSTVVSTLSICNENASTSTYRVAVRVAGAAIDAKQYLFYDATLTKNNSIFSTLGLTLGAGDVVSVYASSTGLSFQLFGSEIS